MTSVEKHGDSSERKGGAMAVMVLQDCTNVILSFSSLRDSLAYGSTCHTNMRNILPDLKRRRKRMVDTFLWTEKDGLKISDSATGDESIADPPLVLPSVRDRVKSLHRSLPITHPLSASVRDFLFYLTEDKNWVDTTDDNTTRDIPREEAVTSNEYRFDDTLNNISSLMKGHRLHASILWRVIRSTPVNTDGGMRISRDQRAQDSALTVPLSLYIGDVLIGYFLMGHSNRGIVEGGPTDWHWMRSIVSDLLPEDLSIFANEAPNTMRCVKSTMKYLEIENSYFRIKKAPPKGMPFAWYRTWVCLHSTLLRLGMFTDDQWSIILGIRTACPVMPMPEPFSSNSISKILINFIVAMGHPNMVPIRMIINDFGRLGGVGRTFRGRDHMQSRTVEFSMIQSAIQSIAQFRLDLLGSHRLQEWNMPNWMMVAHIEAFQNRPMTVTPPLVNIDIPS